MVAGIFLLITPVWHMSHNSTRVPWGRWKFKLNLCLGFRLVSNWWIQTLLFFFHDYIYGFMQNAKRSSEGGAISDSSVSGHPVQTGFHYATLSIIHLGSGSVPLVSLHLSVKRSLAASRDWPPRWEQSPLRWREGDLRPRLATYWARDTCGGSNV